MGTVCAGTSARAAFVLALVASGAPEARAEPPTVPLLLVEPPAGFDAARFATALDTYVPNARIAITAHPGGTPAALCAEAEAAARAVASPVALWARWTRDALVIERVGAAGCSAVESTVVDVALDQPAFVYRVAALKVASLVRELPVPAAPRPVAPPPTIELPAVIPAPAPGAEVGVRVAPAAPPAIRTVEVGVTGIASTEAADRVTLACIGGWFGRGWRFGGTVMLGAAEDETATAGRGSARVFGGFAAVRRALVSAPRWQLEATLEVGLLGVASSATRTGTSVEMRTRVWTPAAALAPRVRVPLAGPLALALGPTLEVSSRAVRLSLGDTPLYHASQLRLRWDVRAELRF